MKQTSDIKNKKNKGFTLIELLVVTSIIGLLASVIASSFGMVRIKAQDSRQVQEVEALFKAIAFYADSNNGSYPTPNESGGFYYVNTSQPEWNAEFLPSLAAWIPNFPTERPPYHTIVYIYNPIGSGINVGSVGCLRPGSVEISGSLRDPSNVPPGTSGVVLESFGTSYGYYVLADGNYNPDASSCE